MGFKCQLIEKEISHLWKGRELVQISNSDKGVTIILDNFIYMYNGILHFEGERFISQVKRSFYFNESDVYIYYIYMTDFFYMKRLYNLVLRCTYIMYM